MKRKAVKLLAVAISAVMLAGCGGNSGSGADNAAESKTEDTEEDSNSSGKTDDGEDRASSGEGRPRYLRIPSVPPAWIWQTAGTAGTLPVMGLQKLYINWMRTWKHSRFWQSPVRNKTIPHG